MPQAVCSHAHAKGSCSRKPRVWEVESHLRVRQQRAPLSFPGHTSPAQVWGPARAGWRRVVAGLQPCCNKVCAASQLPGTCLNSDIQPSANKVENLSFLSTLGATQQGQVPASRPGEQKLEDSQCSLGRGWAHLCYGF